MITIDPTAVLKMIANGIQKSVANLNARWTDIVNEAITQAQTDLQNLMRSKGFTQAQIDAWDDGPVYGRRLTYFFAMVTGSGLLDYSDRDYNKLDCRKELENRTAFSIGGVMTAPGQGNTGSPVGGGTIRANTCDTAEFGATFYFPSERYPYRGGYPYDRFQG